MSKSEKNGFIKISNIYKDKDDNTSNSSEWIDPDKVPGVVSEWKRYKKELAEFEEQEEIRRINEERALMEESQKRAIEALNSEITFRKNQALQNKLAKNQNNNKEQKAAEESFYKMLNKHNRLPRISKKDLDMNVDVSQYFSEAEISNSLTKNNKKPKKDKKDDQEVLTIGEFMLKQAIHEEDK